MAQVGLLCTRIRKEEKALVAALEAVNVEVVTTNPLTIPHFLESSGDCNSETESPTVLLDRCLNRLVVPAIYAGGRRRKWSPIDAGIAAIGNRIDIAQTLINAGIPRPLSAVIPSEEAGMKALQRFGFPSVLFPINPETRGMPVLDKDIAEAVLEHRDTLGHGGERLMLLQAGMHVAEQSATTIVIDGRAVASNDHRLASEEVLALAEASATALHADVCGVTVVHTREGLQVWDIDPVPEFRCLFPVDERDPVEAIVSMVLDRLSFKDESITQEALEISVSSGQFSNRSGNAFLTV